VPPSWRPFVLRDGIVVRAAYELCASPNCASGCERRHMGRGSRHYRDFDSYLLPPATFAALRARAVAAGDRNGFRHLHRRSPRQARHAIEQVTVLARQGELPQVRLDENGLVISPLKAARRPHRDCAAPPMIDCRA
jgi:hypothetical protein